MERTRAYAVHQTGRTFDVYMHKAGQIRLYASFTTHRLAAFDASDALMFGDGDKAIIEHRGAVVQVLAVAYEHGKKVVVSSGQQVVTH